VGVSRRMVLTSGIALAGIAAATGAGYGLVEGGVLPGKYQLDQFLGACGDDPGLPSVTPGRVLTRVFWSRYRRQRVQMITMLPPGSERDLPVALVLHGAFNDAASCVQLGYPSFLAAAVKSGRMPPMALVAADGGPSSWWHRRADGDDPPGMLLHEVLPYLAARGFRTGRVMATGWSMGGFGALLLAERRQASAAAVMSPAIYPTYSAAVAANPGSFDSAADFAHNDVASSTGTRLLRTLPVMVSCGTDDPFAPQVAALRARLGDPSGAIDAGCHDSAYWRRHIPASLAFLGAHLA
jgi:enterochelin esterase-like enzyme